MTVTLVQESNATAAWDFGSAFAALGASPVKQINRNVPDRVLPEPPTPGLTRALSQDEDETPKATPSIDISTALGDFGQALSFLGFSVSVTAPVSRRSSLDSTPDDTDYFATTQSTPTKHSSAHAEKENIPIEAESEANKVTAKQAENGRRAVLESYLGSSPESNTANAVKQNFLKAKTSNKWIQNGLSPSSVMPDAVTRSRKQASMGVAAEKKIQLTLELHKRFPEDFRFSTNLSTPSIESDPTGIHCFVDISNILIGFHDTLKRKRQINRHSRISRQTLSFHNLSIILERNRPAAKRFLAGSDDIDCTQEARLLGYTTHILQRVDKPEYVISPGTRKGKRSGLTSSDTDSGTPGRTRRAEQAVDEVLHLGMLQSLLDTDVPSTIVLASGDAAKAEFSDGFLKQVERALLKGWKVEVIAFQATTGFAYRDPKWTSRWGDSFKLIPLDDFAELLHVPYEGSKF